jgi:hypothetical protein
MVLYGVFVIDKSLFCLVCVCDDFSLCAVFFITFIYFDVFHTV